MTTQTSLMIQTRQLKQEVPGREEPLVILKGIDMEIYAGETVAIVGVSGSGKSTLLGMLAGLDTPSSGHVEIAGRDLTAMDEESRALLRGEMVGFVFQNFQLLPSLTALENVMLPLLEQPIEPSLRLRRENAISEVLVWLMLVRCNLVLPRGLRLRLLQTQSENSKPTDVDSCVVSSC